MLKNITFRIIIRTILLFSTLVLLVFLFLNTQAFVSMGVVFVLSSLQVYLIISELNKTNRQLAIFFDSVKFDDYTMSSRFGDRGFSFRELGRSLHSLSLQFKAIREAKEAQFQFNQNILHNVGVGIIAFDRDGRIEFTNSLFHNMMHVPYCDHLDKIRRFNEELIIQLNQTEPKKKRLFKLEQNGISQNFLLTSSDFIVNNRNLKLVVVQNIQPTIDQTEMEAWQKLISVLTHEIMNSITPISSLADTASQMLPSDDDCKNLHEETINDLREALQTINRRSDGLIQFVQQYRSLTSIPQPNLSVVQVDELFLRVGLLYRTQFNDAAIEFTKEIHGYGFEVIVDSSLIEQVIINLLKNACYAVAGRPNAKVILSALENEFSKIEIHVSDNGCGILPEVLDKIFIPFFTTKSNGSGIGLSLSKQVMIMHGGSISVSSTPGKGSEFVLRF